MKKGAPGCLVLVLGGENFKPTLCYKVDFVPFVEIPIKQPGFNGKLWPGIFSWLTWLKDDGDPNYLLSMRQITIPFASIKGFINPSLFLKNLFPNYLPNNVLKSQ